MSFNLPLARPISPHPHERWRLGAARSTLAVAWLVVVTLLATALPAVALAGNGNNGTIKIHEQGTPSGTESNDPKVCVFNVEAFNLAGRRNVASLAYDAEYRSRRPVHAFFAARTLVAGGELQFR